MRRLEIGPQAIGLELAEAPTDERGQPLAEIGTMLTSEVLEHLAAAGVHVLNVLDPAYANLSFSTAVSQETVELAEAVFAEARAQIASNPTEPLHSKAFGRVVRSIQRDVDEMPLDEATMLYPENDAQRDLIHGLNRASLAVRLAPVVDVSRYRFDLGLAGLLADVGMWLLPQDLLNKEAALDASERRLVEGHVQEAMRLLPTEGGFSATARVAVAQHHERMDGSGYPKGLKGDQIHRIGRLLAVCDVFTALTLERPGRRLYTPNEAHEFVLGASDACFDYDVVMAFHRMVPPYPIGTEVELSTGQRAVVTEIRGPLKSRPVVRVFTDAAGKRLREFYSLDLASRDAHGCTIVGVIG